MGFMDKLRQLLTNYIDENEMILRATLSNSRDREKIQKLRIRPVLRKEALSYQAERFVGTKAYHENLSPEELPALITSALATDFRQLELTAQRHSLTVLVSKKGKLTIKEKETAEQKQAQDIDLSHNKQKQYILPQDEPVLFLVALGVQNAEGKVLKAKSDKFRQINRYLEFVRDILPNLPKEEGQLKIIDFGCGKSYLTFALYYYLKVMNGYDVVIAGLDLKADVIADCQALADKLEYDGLKFQVGDIGTYDNTDSVDMVVTLHACDTATDYAIAKAVQWKARVILSVPCCQHEMNRQLACEPLAPILRYGLIRERMAALMTDAVRANLLEECGYDTQILEFIDMEHTPKNILIRAVRKNQMKYHAGTKVREELTKLEEFLHISPKLQTLLEQVE